MLEGSQTIKIGRVLDSANNVLTTDFGLDRSDFASGIAVLGEESRYTSQLIVALAVRAGYTYLVLDFDGSFRNLLYAVPEARLLRFGTDFCVDPFMTEGLEVSDYVELLFSAMAQAYRVPKGLSRLFLSLVAGAYQGAEGRRLTAAEVQAHVNEWLTLSHYRGCQRELSILRDMLVHVIVGRTGEAFSLPPALSICRLLRGLTIVELSEFGSIEFRGFVEALILVKLFAHLMAVRRRVSDVVVLVDAFEHLFPNPNSLPPGLREPHLQYCVAELKRRGVSLHLSTAFPNEVDRFIVEQVGTRVFHEIPYRWRVGMQFLTRADREFIVSMKPPQAFMQRWDGQGIPLVVDRPEWIFKEGPTDADVESSLLRVGYPIEEVKENVEARVGKDDFELDFGKDVSSAFVLLRAVRDNEGVTRVALIFTLTDVPIEKARPLVNLLERLGYVVEDRGSRRRILKLSMKGLKAIKTWEETHPKIVTFSEKDNAQTGGVEG